MNVVIIGNGAFGNALYTVLTNKTSYVSIWDRKSQLQYADIVILAIPVKSVRSVLQQIQPIKKEVIIINSAKGIEKKTHMLPYQITREVYGDSVNYFALMGPSFAKEVIQEMPTMVNIGFMKKTHGEEIKSLFQTDYFHVRLVKGVARLELSGALKNIYAILCGLVNGLGFGKNTQAKLIALSFEEILSVSNAQHFDIDQIAIPGIIGDLILTCTSKESRNYKFGELLTHYHVEDALKKSNNTVEGYDTISSLPFLIEKTGYHLPLAQFILKIIQENNPDAIQSYFNDFIKRI